MSQLRILLEESHKDLHQWFLLHQECLLLHKDGEGRQALDAFAGYLLAHIEFENAWVLPLAQTGHAGLRWNVTVYHKEHEKLAAMLDDVRDMLEHYFRLQGRERRLALLDVLDRQQTLYHVMEHHEQREEQDLFEHLHLLDVAAEEEWLRVNAQLSDRYGALKEQLKLILESA